MGDYTVKNLKELDDMAEQYGFSDGLEARFARDPRRRGTSKPGRTAPRYSRSGRRKRATPRC